MNRQLLDELFATGRIRLERGQIFDLEPRPLPAGFDGGKVDGMLLGLAIGDALGNTTEGLLPAQRRAQYGEIRDYLPTPYASGATGVPSDDSQMAFWTLEQLLADGRLIPQHLAARFCQQRIFGLGSTVREFIENFKEGRSWFECGPESAGNGALMRIAPMLVPHLKAPTAELWAGVAISGMITHNDRASTASCVALVHMLWQLLAMQRPPTPEWWLETFVTTARELEGNEGRYRPRSPAYADYHGPLWRFVEQEVTKAHEQRLSTLEACNRWYSGAFLLETVPAVIYILMQHGTSVEESIVRAVNDTKDNDTVAAIVGAAVGALHGRDAIPQRWIENHSGRTTDRDDGKIFELIRDARRRWG